MSENSESYNQLDDIDVRRKRLIFRSWHRGTKEMDMLLGQFADAHLHHFTAQQLDQYERILKNSDPDLYNWISGNEPLPPAESSAVMTQLFQNRLK